MQNIKNKKGENIKGREKREKGRYQGEERGQTRRR